MANKNHCPRLLIVDDQPSNIQFIRSIFPAEYDIFMATNAQAALDVCIASKPDLILLDVVMPGINGLVLSRMLKERSDTQDIPIIFITALDSFQDETACWDAGCVDFVNKPFNPTTLLNRVKVHLTLKKQADYLYEQSRKDGLTGICNRRAFDERLKIEFLRAKRTANPLALFLIDVDFFKVYNDTHGHLAGDDCLKKIAKKLQKKLKRSTDLIARYGGDEFVCLLPETNIKNALSIAEKLRESVEPIRSISIGVAVYPDSPCNSPQDLIALADMCLYEAKKHNRNQRAVSNPKNHK